MEVKCFTLSGAREIFAPLRERTRCTMDSLHARRFDRGRKGLSGQGRMEERNIGELICLRNHSEFLFAASSWFSSKWDIPSEVYEESMKECMERKTGILQWYMIVDGQRNTIAGAGVIENDFHDRKDLTPNLCALFVEERKRGRGIAGVVPDFVRKDLASLGYPRLPTTLRAERRARNEESSPAKGKEGKIMKNRPVFPLEDARSRLPGEDSVLDSISCLPDNLIIRVPLSSIRKRRHETMHEFRKFASPPQEDYRTGAGNRQDD